MFKRKKLNNYFTFILFLFFIMFKSWFIIKNIPSALLLFYRKNKKTKMKEIPFYGMHFLFM